MIYFIQEKETTNIKIGYATDVYKRLSAMQTGNSSELVLLGAVEGFFKTEKHIHDMFSRFHKRGEWFFCHQEILDYIEKYNQPIVKRPSVRKADPVIFEPKAALRSPAGLDNFLCMVDDLNLNLDLDLDL